MTRPTTPHQLAGRLRCLYRPRELSSEKELLGDPLLRMAARAADPMRGVPIPPPRLSAALIAPGIRGVTSPNNFDLGEAAMISACIPTHSRTRHRSARMWIAAFAAATVVALAAGCQHRRDPHPDDGPAPAAGSPAAATSSQAGCAAQAWPSLQGSVEVAPAQQLAALADRLCDTTSGTAPGGYVCIHTQQWARATTVVGRFDLRRCHGSDGAGQETERRLPDRPGLLPLPDGRDRAEFDHAPPHTRHYAAGELRLDVPEPVPTDPAELTDALLQHRPAPAGQPDFLTNRIVDLATGQYLDRAQRAALLRVLAGVPDLHWLGPTTDIAGRTGIGIQQRTDSRTITLIYAADTGGLLAFQDVIDRPPPGTRVRSGLWQYLLLLDIDHQPTPPDPAASTASTP